MRGENRREAELSSSWLHAGATLVPVAQAPGRNDPCRCGSGRKFKHCCLVRQGADEAARLRIRTLETRVVDPAAKYALERWGAPLFRHAWEDFWNYEPPAGEFASVPEFDAMFHPWFTTSFVADPESDERTDDWPTRTLAQEWLAVQPAPVDPAVRAYVERTAASPMSVFAVEAVTPGVAVDIKDILTGRQFHALELTASRSLQTGDVIFTRVVTLEGASVMFGMAPYAAPPDWHLRTIDWREAVFKGRLPTPADLHEYDIEIRDPYLLVRDAVLHPAPPTLTNSDGDLLRFVTLTYDLHVTVEAAYESLLPLATLKRERHESEVDRGADGVVQRAVLNWVKAGNKQHASWSNTVLGTLTISAGRVVAEVNSTRRATRLQREIARRLGPGALASREAIDPVEQLVETRAKQEARKGLHLVEPRPATIDPALAAAEAELRRRHLEDWLTEKVPALGGTTPRQAARTPAGRERLDALLVAFRRGPGRYSDGDIAYLRSALKLAAPPAS